MVGIFEVLEVGVGLVLELLARALDDEERCCLLAGGSLAPMSSSEISPPPSRTASGLRRFWRSRRSFSNCARSDRNADPPMTVAGPESEGFTASAVEVWLECRDDSALEAAIARSISAWNLASSSLSSLSESVAKSITSDSACGALAAS